MFKTFNKKFHYRFFSLAFTYKVSLISIHHPRTHCSQVCNKFKLGIKSKKRKKCNTHIMVETQNSLDNIEDTHMHVVHAALHKSGDSCIVKAPIMPVEKKIGCHNLSRFRIFLIFYFSTPFFRFYIDFHACHVKLEYEYFPTSPNQMR